MRVVNRDLVLRSIARGGEREQEPADSDAPPPRETAPRTPSRADIAKQTGLTKATVSSQVAELIDAGLVRERGLASTEHGRRPIILELAPEAGYVVGIGLSGQEFSMALTDFQGEVRCRRTLSFRAAPHEEAEQRIAEAIESAIEELPPTRYGLIGIGFSVPGVVEASDESVVSAGWLRWDTVRLTPFFSERFGCVVAVGNDAKLAAYAERECGYLEANMADDFLCVLLGEGIGVGAFLGGKPYGGHRGYFGEAGHLPMNQDGPLCWCGNRGCWNSYASENALYAELQGVREGNRTAATGSVNPAQRAALTLGQGEAVELFHSNEPAIRASFAAFSDRLTTGLVGLINVFSPSALILNSRLLAALPALFAEVAETTRKRVLPFNRDCAILLSNLGSDAPVRGALGLATERFLAEAVSDLDALRAK